MPHDKSVFRKIFTVGDYLSSEKLQSAVQRMRHSGLNPDCVVDAAGTLRRIVHRLSGIASGRLALQQFALPIDMQAARAACDTVLRHHLRAWLEVLTEEPGPDRHHIREVAAHVTSADLATLLPTLQERLSASGVEELAVWPAEACNLLLAEIESYRRLNVLVSELDQQFVEIPSATTR